MGYIQDALKVRPIRPHAALLLENVKGEKYIAVSDLHIGLEQELDSKGVTLRSNLVEEMTSEIEELVASCEAVGIVLLGDIKHKVGTISKQEWDDIPRFMKRLSSAAQVYLVPGNHDSNIRHLVPPVVNVISSKGMTLEDTLFVHGHSMPSNARGFVNRIVMGHLHPVFLKGGSVVNGQRVWIYVQAKKEALFSERGTIEIVIVPSFNRYLYAMGARPYRKSISPIITRIMERKENIEKCVVATLDGSIIGDAELLATVF